MMAQVRKINLHNIIAASVLNKSCTKEIINWSNRILNTNDNLSIPTSQNIESTSKVNELEDDETS